MVSFVVIDKYIFDEFVFLESMISFLNRRYISKKKSQLVSESSGNALQKI